MKHNYAAAFSLALFSSMSMAQAADIESVSPQGSQSKVSAIDIVFSEPVIPLGRNDLPAPAAIACKGSDIKGHGKWSDGAHWSYEFEQILPAGVECTITPDTSFKDTKGQAVKGKPQYRFDTGRLEVTDISPSSEISEDQAFLVRFNMPADPASLQANAVCVVEGLGEQIPVQVMEAGQKKKIIDEARSYLSDDIDKIELLSCGRRLPAGAKGRLLIADSVTSKAGLTMEKSATNEFTVRKDFSAGYSCTRENQQANCTPVLPIYLTLSESVSTQDAAKITLTGPDGKTYPGDIDKTDDLTGSVKFPGPFPENQTLTLALPPGLKDDSGRAVSNAAQFPMTIRTASFPPMLKFASSSFGIIERKAENQAGKAPWLVPVTVRYLEDTVSLRDQTLSPGSIQDYVPQDDADVLKAYARVRRLNETSMTAENIRAVMNDQEDVGSQGKNPVYIDTRSVSMLAENKSAQTHPLPGASGSDRREYEVLGVPLQRPGFHVLEAKSNKLGQALIANKSPMYVRSTVLVTNMAVHVKQGRDDLLVWVTALDDAKPVSGALVNVLDCAGTPLLSGETNADGVWHYRKAVKGRDYCASTELSGLFVSARIPAEHPQAGGVADYSFAFTTWNDGIESWRFNVPTNSSAEPTVKAHTILDRSLFRAGETVSMKHLLRTLTRDGFALPADGALPPKMAIELVGGEDRYEMALDWKATRSGGKSSDATWKIPKDVKRGQYQIVLDPDGHSYSTAEFRVEDFKLPLLAGQINVRDADHDQSTLIAPASVNLDMQLYYLSGGGAGKLPVAVSALARDRGVSFADYDDYSFSPPSDTDRDQDEQSDGQGDEVSRIIVDKKELVLDAQGHGKMALTGLPRSDRPQSIMFEGSFMDPNGEVQTISRSVPVWPSSYVAGIRTGYLVQQQQKAGISVVALDTNGKPVANAPVAVRAVSYTYQSVRKRLVGGFYSYDTHRVTQDLGTVCEGSSATDGKFACDIQLKQQGTVNLVATVSDPQGRQARAESSVYVVGEGEFWFSGENNDRIDIIPEKKSYAPGEQARFQVRMPFRQANALIAVEREGVLETRLVSLAGTDPSFTLDIKPEWGPNVYVSVLALRGRVRDSAQNPELSWGEANATAAQVSALIDLAKPAYRFGLAGIRVTSPQHALNVAVSTDKPRYQVRDTANATIRVTLPDGKPAANASVALAVVDQALLELSPNTTWDLLKAMLGERAYGVETATAQMEIVGRRHYGRKALPPGGGGGSAGAPTRELLDTLVLWKPEIVVDENGQAVVPIPLNDSISAFQVVAVADLGKDRFGDAKAKLVTTQDLQMISGLPLVVRNGDRYSAIATVRNATDRKMRVTVGARVSSPDLAPRNLDKQTLEVEPQSAARVSWDLDMASLPVGPAAQTLKWQFDAREEGGGNALDRVAVSQMLIPTVPLTLRQATLQSVQASEPLADLPVQPPQGALTGQDGKPQGGVQVQLSKTLTKGLEPVRRWFGDYAYTCLEQLSSIAVGLDDPQRWQALMNRLPVYMDAHGLVGYFPGLDGDEVLTAHLISVSNQASEGRQPYAIPQAYREKMLQGLMAFVEGKIRSRAWSPGRDDTERKLLVLEALAREGMVTPRLMSTVDLRGQRSTAALVDWLSILLHTPSLPDRAQTMANIRSGLLSRVSRQGGSMVLADSDNDYPWWMMSNREVVTARLLTTVMKAPAWQKDVPLLMTGLLGMQQKGTWSTTTANLWGTLAVRAFSAQFEKTPVKGTLTMTLAGTAGESPQQWEGLTPTQKVLAPWPDSKPRQLSLSMQGSGRVWASLGALAAVPVTQPVYAGYTIQRHIEPVSQAASGAWAVGDIYRVRLEINAKATMNWVVLSDPVPAGATILGSGLGRDSAIATTGEKREYDQVQASFTERKSELYRAYYAWLPAGKTSLEYTVRLNTPGRYSLPATRIEAMYAPQVYGELPNNQAFIIKAAAQDASTGAVARP